MAIPFLDALEITAPQEVATFTTSVGACGLYVAAADPNTVLTANTGSVCMSKDGTCWRKATGEGTNDGWVPMTNLSVPPAPPGEVYMVTVDENGTLSSQSINTGNSITYNEYANVAALPGVIPPAEVAKVLTNQVLYHSLNGSSWEVLSMSVTGSDVDKDSITEQLIGQRFHVQNTGEAFWWDGADWQPEGP